MNKAATTNEVGLVDPPIHPRYRVEDRFCQLQTKGKPSKFQCGQTPEICRYLRKKEKKEES